jgi:hypothetical protein
MAKNKIALLAFSFAMGACHRLDTLTVIDNPYGAGVIIDNIYGNDRVICIVRNVQSDCRVNNASIIVKDTKEYSDVNVGWVANNIVDVHVNGGEIQRADSSAIDGHVKITVT